MMKTEHKQFFSINLSNITPGNGTVKIQMCVCVRARRCVCVYCAIDVLY